MCRAEHSVLGFGYGEKRCEQWRCEDFPHWAHREAWGTALPGEYDLRHSDVTGGFQTVQATGPDAYDVSDCEGGVDSKRGGCVVRCKAPRYVGKSVHLKCLPNGTLVAPHIDCRLAYDRTAVVQTESGPVRGLTRPVGCQGAECVESFFGLPYAAPPTGELRFRPPQPIQEKWLETKDLPGAPPPACLGWMGTLGGSVAKNAVFGGGDDTNATEDVHLQDEDEQDPEDCLYLSLFVPKGVDGPLPVLLHIFAGGFVGGDNWGNGNFDGAGMALKNRAIVVTPAFRIGLLGHFALKALKETDPQETTGNYGLQDQRAVMQWLHRNVRSFGGDPSRIHIMGVSSGAFSVHWHRLSPKSQNLFQAATMHGSVQQNEWWWQHLDDADAFYNVLAAEAGCPVNNTHPMEVRSCLQSLSAQDLHKATTKNHMPFVFFNKWQFNNYVWSILESTSVQDLVGHASRTFSLWKHKYFGHRVFMRANPAWPMLPAGPCIDGSEEGLPLPARDLIRQGRVSQATAVGITAHDEGSMFLPLIGGAHPTKAIGYPCGTRDVRHLVEWWMPNLTDTVLQDYYKEEDFMTPNARVEAIITDALFRCSNYFSARMSTIAGGGKFYVGEWNTAIPSAVRPILGASHGDALSHIWYYGHPKGFTPTENTFTPGQKDLALWLNCMMARLAYCADPNGCAEDHRIPSCQEAQAANIAAKVDKLRPYTAKSVATADLDPTAPEQDTRFVVSVAEDGEPGERADVRNTPYEAVDKRRCALWDRSPFSFVPSFYNEGMDALASVDGECLGQLAIHGSETWPWCSVLFHAESCESGGKQKCCCEFGYKYSKLHKRCVQCDEEQLEAEVSSHQVEVNGREVTVQAIQTPAAEQEEEEDEEEDEEDEAGSALVEEEAEGTRRRRRRRRRRHSGHHHRHHQRASLAQASAGVYEPKYRRSPTKARLSLAEED